MAIEVERGGFLVNCEAEDGARTYACADKASLVALVERLSGRKWGTLSLDERGFPKLPWLRIAAPLHIYREV